MDNKKLEQEAINTEMARKAQAKYMREWRKKNPEKERENRRRYWARKAKKEMLNESEADVLMSETQEKETNTAKWVHVGSGAYKCTNCGAVYQKMNYCGNCGKEMVVSEKTTKKKSKKAPRYYAVKKGDFATIVTTWAMCEALVKGEPGARHKKFATRKEAEAWLETI